MRTEKQGLHQRFNKKKLKHLLKTVTKVIFKIKVKVLTPNMKAIKLLMQIIKKVEFTQIILLDLILK